MVNERIKWLDVLKFIGIVEIVFGHLGINNTMLGTFVWTHHVPLFFFAAGAVVSHEPVPFKELFLKKSKTLLLPWIFFALLSITVYALLYNIGARQTLELLLIVVNGCIRNAFFAHSLWFLTCLFVICFVFELLKRMKHNILILLFCFILFLISELVLPIRPIVQPTMVWNLDSAMYYIIYYAIGYISFPYINKLLEKQNSRIVRSVYFFSEFLAILFCAAVFFGHNPLTKLRSNPFLDSIVTLITSLIIIWALIFISYVFRNIKLLNIVGQNTLYICGNEFITKTMITSILTSFGIQFSITDSLVGLIYVFFILLIICKILMPVEKAILDSIMHL